MRHISFALMVLFVVAFAPVSARAQSGPPGYERGFLVMLQPGPRMNELTQDILMKHGAFVTQLMTDRKADVAGPFAAPAPDLQNSIGFIVLRAADEADARRILNADVTFSGGHFAFKLIGTWLPPRPPTDSKPPKS